MSLSTWYELSDLSFHKDELEYEIGVYLLNKTTRSGVKTWYVGRSDNDLYRRLRRQKRETNFTRFKYEVLTSTRAAFWEECRLYHRYKNNHNDRIHEKLKNEDHPQNPVNQNWKCPVKGCSDFY